MMRIHRTANRLPSLSRLMNFRFDCTTLAHVQGLYWSAMRPIWSYAGLPRPFETVVVRVMPTYSHLQSYLALGQTYYAV
jgi:hypothetical protein